MAGKETATTAPAEVASPVGYARIAGVAYLLVILLGVITVGLVDARLVVAGDHLATAANIAEHESLFRVGLVGVLVLYASVLVLSWALYVVVKPINEHIGLLALILRCAEGVLGCATAILSLVALAALRTRTGSDGVDPALFHGAVGVLLEARSAAMDVVLLFVGPGGAAFCYLLFVARLIPRALAAWGIITYASMVVLAALSILWPEHPAVLETVLYGAGTLFELTIGLWLLIKAVDVARWRAYVRVQP